MARPVRWVLDDYRRWRPMVERSIAWVVAKGNRRVPVPGGGEEPAGPSLRLAVLNLRRMINLGLDNDGEWLLRSYIIPSAQVEVVKNGTSPRALPIQGGRLQPISRRRFGFRHIPDLAGIAPTYASRRICSTGFLARRGGRQRTAEAFASAISSAVKCSSNSSSSTRNKRLKMSSLMTQNTLNDRTLATSTSAVFERLPRS